MRRIHLIHALTCTVLVLSFATVAGGSSGTLDRPRSIGEWSNDCELGFRLATLPNGWVFNPEQGPLLIVSRVAIDFEQLPADTWVVLSDDRGEEYSDLVGYSFMALEARVTAVGEEGAVATLDGIYSDDRPAEPVLFEWDGRDRQGRPLPAGLYQIEVRGRFVPVEVGLTEDDGFTYSDLEGWSVVAEACTRVLTVELTDRYLDDPPSRGISCPDPPADYYATVDDSNSTTLRNTLHPVIDDHTKYPYSSTSTDTWDILNDADENPSDPSKVLCVYKNSAFDNGCTGSCPWQREHVWASSFGFSENTGPGGIPYTDCYNLHVSDGPYNSAKGNLQFNTCTSGCTDYPTVANNGFGGGAGDINRRSGDGVSCETADASDVWETWPHRRGDNARTIMYMDIRYEGDTGAMGEEQDLIATSELALIRSETTNCTGADGYQDPGYHGILSTLVTWADNDLPDPDEQRRNQQVWCYQANRNPFTDHPEWVDCLYLNDCVAAGPAFAGIASAADQGPCADTGVLVSWATPSNWNDGCTKNCSRGFRVYRDGAEVTDGTCDTPLSATTTSCVDSTGTNGLPHFYTVEAFNHNGAVEDGDALAKAGDFVDDGAAPVISSGPSAVPAATSFTASWTTDEYATSVLQWDIDSGEPYASSSSSTTPVLDHSRTATPLTTETLYYYRVCSSDPCGYGPTCSAELQVTTTPFCDPTGLTPVFVNELHYDDYGADDDEMVEVAGPAGTDLGGAAPWTIELYNGLNGALYDTIELSGVIPNSGNGYGVIEFPISGIQNGTDAVVEPPTPAYGDGLALIDSTGTVVQFLCYEVSFTATSGTAIDLPCTLIGVAELGTEPEGLSLQLTGGPGYASEHFTWTGPTARSPNAFNLGAGQALSCGPVPAAPTFAGLDHAADQAPCVASGVLLEWTAPSAWNDGCGAACNRGFRVWRDAGTRVLITSGGCASPLPASATSCIDTSGTVDTYYTYSIEAFNHLGGVMGGGFLDAADWTSDGSAPEITGGPTTSSTSFSFTATWMTDEYADSYLEWGTVPSVYTDNVSDASLRTSHSLTADRLTPSTDYYYRVCSTDRCWNGPACSEPATAHTAGGCTGTPVFINEFHYDNDGTDTGEFIEVAGPAGTSLASWTIVPYNGNGGAPYTPTISLSGSIPDQSNGYGTRSFSATGLQNGSPDGFALVNSSGVVVQFLCYEGSFEAVGGPADGTLCTDVGVYEPSTSPVGYSLQLTGTSIVYEEFTWNPPSDDSPGSINAGQTFTCGGTVVEPVQAFTATATGTASAGQVKLEWVNPKIGTSYSTTRICWDTADYPADPTACTSSHDEPGAANTYDTWTDGSLINGTLYYYAAFVRHTDGTYSEAAEVTAKPFDATVTNHKWTYSTGASTLAPPGILPGPLTTGSVYGVSNDRLVHAMNPTASGGDWPRSTPFSWEPLGMNAPAQHRPPIIPLAVGPRAFLASQDGYAYSVNARTGDQVWRSPLLGDMLLANPVGLFSDLVPGAPNLLFVGTRVAGAANTLYALSPTDGGGGAIVDSFDNEGGPSIGIITGILVDYDTEYVYFTSRAGGSNHTVWCLDAGGPSLSWQWSTAVGDVDGAPTLYDGRVYVGTNASNLVALDATTGAVAWTFAAADGAVKGYPWPRFGTSELAFVTTHTVWSVQDNGGSASELWRVTTIPYPSVPLALPGTSHLLVGGGDGTLYQLDFASGAETGSVSLGYAALGSPAADVVNSMVLVGSEYGVINGVVVPLP